MVKGAANPSCVEAPDMAGCEPYLEARQACARECYVASVSDPTNPMAKMSYICAWDGGRASWGSRYLRLAEMFGDDGIALGICAPDGFGPVMQRLGGFVSGAMER